MFNRFSNTSSLSTPVSSAGTSFFGGQPQPQTNSIPQSTSPFTPFGASVAAAAGTSPSSISSLGAPSIPYAITNEIENGITVKLLSITAMPAYRHLSQDEIRVDDYSKGRKGPSSFPGSQPGAFSQPFSSSATSGAGGFPYSSSSTTPGGFSGFGSNATTTTPASTGFGSFTPATATTATSTTAPSSGFGGFGSGAFGSSSTSGFGTSSGTGTGTGTFGSSNTRGFGSFGATQPSTTTTPSNNATGFGGFGSSSNIGANAFGTSTPGMFGGFGQTQSQPQTQMSQPFGQPASTTSTMFGAKPSTSIFGSTPAPTPAFGSSALGTSFSTAQPSTPQAQQSTGFGQVQQPQSQQSAFGSSASTGMFGSTTGGGIFGTSSSTPASSTPFTSTSSGMFGQATQQPSIFGTTPTTTTATSSNLFRPTTTAASTFGSTSTTPSTMFGASSGLANTSTTGMAGMFNRPSTLGSTSTTANTTAALPSTSTGGFSFQPLGTASTGFSGLSSQPQSQSQGQTTSLYQPAALPLVEPAPAGSLSLFPPLPPIFTKPSVNATTATVTEPQAPQHPVKFTPRTSFRIKPRESYNLTTPIPINFGTGPLSSGSGTTTTATNAATNLVPRKMMNGSIPNIKKLVVPDFNNISEPSTPQGSKDNVSYKESYTPYISATSSTLTPHISNLTPSTSNSILTDSMQFGQQYTFPPLKILKTTDRRSIKNFVIGQKGVGEVRFLVPVDLSEIDPDRLFGNYIEFSDCEAVMYPDPSIPKPEPGHGLNLPAQVRLERVWTMSKGSRDPIVDPQSEKVIHFIQKLKETEGTNFISYEPSTGTWTFTVDNF